jgi:hypothetical protein
MPDKVIVSNNGALAEKYGAAGFASIMAAVQSLIAADAAKGLATTYVPLDDAAAMAALHGVPVRDATDQPANKAAIDAVYNGANKPDYVMILGSMDVVPHQDLVNPMFVPANPPADPDATVPSDLPYACDAPFSTAADDFIAPSRVVGRLPDLTGGTNAAKNAVGTSATGIAALGITAQAWQVSTDMSLKGLFGPAAASQTSPAQGPNWTAPNLGALVHFINCHGALSHPQFHGEPNNYPVAHDAVWITKKIAAGTIAAVECCYGADLYDPAKAGGQMGISNTYMDCGAAGYVGSTTIAYGPANSNAYADLICSFFIEEVLAGKSTGDALLSSRLRYVKASLPIDPVDLKTLAQFLLLGDPSIHPVTPVPKGAALPKGMPAMRAVDQSAAARRDRRGTSRGQANEIETTHPVSDTAIDVPPGVEALMKTAIDSSGMERVSMRSFGTTLGRGGLVRPKGILAATTPARVHIATGRRKDVAPHEHINYSVVVVAKEEGGKLLAVQTIYGKSRGARAEW